MQKLYINLKTRKVVKKLVTHHSIIGHNAPCLPPKFCISIVFDFSCEDCNTQEKLETMVMQNFGG